MSLLWTNLLAYSLQVGVLVAVAAFVPAALRLRLPQARLAFWHVLLAACLLLPLVRPWRQDSVAATTQITTTVLAVGQPAGPARRSPPAGEIALAVLAAGALARFGWLAAGFWKLRRYRRDSRRIDVPLPWKSPAEVRVAEAVASPVTFGLRRPVILVPPQFLALAADARRAILCHELLHVTRLDWLFTVAEEFVRAVLWFHPAIWWLLGEIQLSREQAVDREVVRLTSARDEYVDALLAVAGRHDAPAPDLLPAPLFLRKRHLKQRVVSIFEEVCMSKTRLVSALAAGLCILVAACWFVTGAFPLSAAPQTAADAPGVTVDLGGATLLHRSGVNYPEAARKRGVQGTVTVEVTLDSVGNVTDAHVLNGPEELRGSTLQSILQWHFSKEFAGMTRQVTLGFALPAGPAATEDIATERARTEAALQKRMQQGVEGRRISSVRFSGMSNEVSSELSGKLPIHVGDTATPDLIEQVTRVVKGYDEHMGVFALPTANNEVVIQVTAPGAAAVVPDGAIAPNRIKVGGNVQAVKLIQQARPIYPPEAKAQRIQGTVKLSVVIAKDGTVKDILSASGDAMLVNSAIDAVRQWVYQPTLLNGQPVEVQTMIDVNYTLSQ
jgi:TonB family protein